MKGSLHLVVAAGTLLVVASLVTGVVWANSDERVLRKEILVQAQLDKVWNAQCAEIESPDMPTDSSTLRAFRNSVAGCRPGSRT